MWIIVYILLDFIHQIWWFANLCAVSITNLPKLAFDSHLLTVFPKSRQHVCFVRRRIQMSDVGFVKIISIWCLSVQFGRRSMKSIREDCVNMQ